MKFLPLSAPGIYDSFYCIGLRIIDCDNSLKTGSVVSPSFAFPFVCIVKQARPISLDK